MVEIPKVLHTGLIIHSALCLGQPISIHTSITDHVGYWIQSIKVLTLALELLHALYPGK